jgi:RNA methyltransferase, TrmH family
MGNETNVCGRQLEFAPVLTQVKKLQSDRRYRDGKGLFFAEGIRNFVEAVDRDFPIETIIYSEKLLISPVARKMVRRLKREGIPFARASPEQFRQISQTERASGIAAIYRQNLQQLDQIKPAENICWTVLSSIRSNGNLGTLIRTSAAIGAGGFIFFGNEIDVFAPDVVRPTMGAIFKQKIVRTNLAEFQKWLKLNKLQVVGASPSSSADYHKISYQTPTILMLGNERKGLTDVEKSFCSKLVRIPMVAGMDSLNVAVAGSLLLYEVFRTTQNKNEIF